MIRIHSRTLFHATTTPSRVPTATSSSEPHNASREIMTHISDRETTRGDLIHYPGAPRTIDPLRIACSSRILVSSRHLHMPSESAHWYNMVREPKNQVEFVTPRHPQLRVNVCAGVEAGTVDVSRSRRLVGEIGVLSLLWAAKPPLTATCT